jgi:cytoskeletal protein RodZ
VLWENYKNSVTAFAAFYGLYFVSSYIGVVVPVALATGLFVAFTLTPSTLKEKAFAELDKTIQQVRTSVTSRISLTPPLPEKEKEDEPSSPRSAKKSPARKPVSPLVDPIVPEPEALKEVNDAPNIEE